MEAMISWIKDDAPIPMAEHEHVALGPKTAGMIIDFIAAVVEWAMQAPKKWGLGEYNINTVAKYKMVESAPATRKTFAPRGSEFSRLVKAAEELGLTYMIPLMALTRCTFRPSESRAIRWSDFTTKDIRGKVWDAATLHGTIRVVKGKGETWVPEAKTEAAIDDPVVIPKSIMTLLRR